MSGTPRGVDGRSPTLSHHKRKRHLRQPPKFNGGTNNLIERGHVAGYTGIEEYTEPRITTMPLRRQLLLFVLFVAVAAAMRFYRLGEWSFGFDEFFTTIETKVLMGERPIPPEHLQGGALKEADSPLLRLPRMIPVSYFIHWLDYRLFGEDEFGSRVLMAAIGSLSVGVIFVLALPILGQAGSLGLALLVLLWPEHVLQSQENRFYSQSFFFISVVLLLGGHVVVRRSTIAALWLGPTAFLMVLCHVLGGVAWGALLGGVVLDVTFRRFIAQEKEKIPWKLLAILGGWTVLLVLHVFFYVAPLAKGWNDDVTWGCTPLYACLAFGKAIGLPLFLLCGFGLAVGLADFRRHGGGYWACCAVVCGLAVILLPLRIVYNPWYTILFSLPFLAVAALFLERVYRFFADSGIPYGRGIGVFWLLACPLVQTQSLLSYYADGGRPDLRTAFHYVRDHWQEGDRLTGFWMGAAEWYIPEQKPRIPLRPFDTATRLQQILDDKVGGDGRLWIVVQSERGGLDRELCRWLSRNALFEIRFMKKRFDHIENNVEVFLYMPSGR